jgi:hypothetical protein
LSVDSRANAIALHPNPGRLGSDVVVADTDVDGLARQFLDSAYCSDQYANWPLDRRLEGFLQHRGLGHLADNGDLFTIICDRVMTTINCQRLHGGGNGESSRVAHCAPITTTSRQ